MKELINKIKYNRLPKEVLFLLGILNDIKYISVDGQTEYDKSVYITYYIINSNNSYVLFRVNATERIIETNNWNIMIVLDTMTNRTLGKSYNLSDSKNALTAIKSSDFYFDYKII